MDECPGRRRSRLPPCSTAGSSSGRAAVALARESGRLRRLIVVVLRRRRQRDRHGRSRSAPTRPTRCRRRPTRRRSRLSRAPAADVKVNTVDHNTFQEQINTYLQGTPGRRVHLVRRLPDAVLRRRRAWPTPIDDVWEKIGGNYSDAIKKASTGEDGKQYFVPIYNYPWALFYRKSVFAGQGLQDPDDAGRADDARRADEEGRADADRVRRQGRLAGDGHVRQPQHAHQRLRLPHRADEGQGVLDRPQGRDRLRHWSELLPYTRPARSGRTWQEAAQTLANKKAGMYLLGTFVGQQFTDRPTCDDLDFFAFPEIDSSVRPGRGRGADRRLHDGQEAARTTTAPRSCWSTWARPRRENTYLATDPNDVGRPTKADTSEVQRAAEEGGRADRRRQEHLPVPGPRRRPDLRLHGDDPVVPEVHQEPRRRRLDR